MLLRSTYFTVICLITFCFAGQSCAQSSRLTPKQKVESATIPPASNISDLREQRQKTKYRTRRIIMNNDGNDFHLLDPNDLEQPKKFLERRTTPLIDSHVDSIFYCTGVFNKYMNPMNDSEWFHNSDRFDSKLAPLMRQRSVDSLNIMIEFCHAHDKEIFWSMRMNDTHDASYSFHFSQWKKDHPDCLVGKKEDLDKMKYGGRRWSSLDYNKPQVRDKVFSILSEICGRYDVDGVELDFFRHPVIFKEQMYGEPINQAQRDKVTDMIRRIRTMTETEGLRRGKPFLISIRVPDSVDYCRAIGLDIEKWLQEGLIDIVTGGGYFKLEPWENLVALGKKYDVPVYACLVRRRIEPVTSEPEGEDSLLIWRGEAYNAWKAGV
ncbi:MAG: family 10 glycosylhydrolase, partial [Sedimentisphaerales bacterium]|nr:family 10 glycosylhydrolase [Sedimentisphaerales bacterium]